MNMKMKMKALSFALFTLTVLTAAPASAQLLSNQGTTGNSELALFVWDTAANTSYIRDLGIQWKQSDLSVFNSNATISGDSTSNYSTFLTKIGGASATTQWAVVSASYGVANGNGLVTTAPAAPVYTNSGIQAGNYQTIWSSIVTNFGVESVIAGLPDNSSLLPSDAGLANVAAAANGWSFGFGGGSVAYGIVGGSTPSLSLSFYDVVKNGSFGNAKDSKLGAWTFTAATGALSYVTAAVVSVPESDTWAMLLAGLGVMGFIGRNQSRNRI